MRWVVLLALLLLPQDPQDQIRSLVEKLGGDDVEAREEAEMRVRRLGTRALPDLEVALKTAGGVLKFRIERAIQHIRTFGTPPLVTLESKDRPLREIAEALQRQTSIPVRPMAGAADLTASVSAKDTILWKVVEDLCRTRGDVMYRFVNDSIEIHASKFRALPNVDHGALRFFVDRLIVEGGFLNPAHIRMHGGILVPRGARLLRSEIKVQELTDDTGLNVAQVPEGGGFFVLEGNGCRPGSRIFAFPVAWHPTVQGAPAPAATRIARLRGVANLVFGGGEHVLASVKDPLARPSTPPSGPFSLGITRWSVSEYGHSILLSAVFPEEESKEPDFRYPRYPVLRLKGGDSIPPQHGYLALDSPFLFVLPKDAVVESLDIVDPKSPIKVEFPFEFRDIPLR